MKGLKQHIKRVINPNPRSCPPPDKKSGQDPQATETIPDKILPTEEKKVSKTIRKQTSSTGPR